MTTARKHAPKGEVPGKVVSIEDAVHETVHNTLGVHPKALADAMGLPHRTLLDIADQMRPRSLRAAEVPLLINGTFLLTGTRNYLVLDVIEQAVGRVGVVPPAAAVGPRDEHAMALVTMREFVQQQQHYLAVMDDGQVTEAEAASYEREANELQAAIESMKALVRSRVRGAAPLRTVGTSGRRA